eukprot:s218_g8.t1
MDDRTPAAKGQERERLGENRKRGPEKGLEEVQRKRRKGRGPAGEGRDAQTRGKGQKPHSDAEVAKQESLETVMLGDGAGHSLDVLKSWLKTEECGGLTIAQSGALLALCIHRSGTPVGQLLDRMLVPGSTVGQEEGRQRGLLPLPLLEDSATTLRELFSTGEFRRLAGSWGAKQTNKEKAAKASRRVGMLIWHGLVVTYLNQLWTGGGSKAKVCTSTPTKGQKEAMDRLWAMVRDFVDDTSEVDVKVPKSPTVGEWGQKLGDVRISYHGEIVEKGHQLTLDQIKPGLPPGGYGASVPLIELGDGELKEKLMDPVGNLLEEDEMPEDVPRPKVHASQDQWNLIAKDLYERGLVEPVEEPLMVKGKPLLNGSFGVIKPGKYLDDERPVLRLIMDFRATNAVTKVLTGDVRSLTGAPALQHIVLPEGQVLRVSADDLVAAFYLFALPKGWSQLMCFEKAVPWRCLGIEKAGEVHIGAKVLPMGWASAVGVLQHAHRRLALRSPLAGAGLLGKCEIRRDSVFPDMSEEEALWSLYLDDTSLLETMSARVAKDLEGVPSEEQLRMVYSTKLTAQGIKESHALDEGLETPLDVDVNLDEDQVVLVIDLFAGIGGLSRALQLAKVKVARLVVIEQDVECRRLNAARYPGCDLLVDIRKVTRKEIEKIMRSVPGLTGVIAAGGSPCQGLSKLSAFREHLDDPRSKLFFDLSRILGDIIDVAEEMKVWVIGMVENVVGDEKDIEEMSQELGARPVLACASALSRVRRPRLYWCNVHLEDHPSYTWAEHKLYGEVIFQEEMEPLEKVCDDGWSWPAGTEDENQKLPTFTRAIPRVKPPPYPAGLASCSKETLRFWREDQMKYPPYTYQAPFLFKKVGGEEKRVASVTERERLMGYPAGYTKALFKHEAKTEEEKKQQIIKREAALGNSFHAVVVGCLLDLWLWSKGIRTDPLGATAIVESWHREMGNAELSDYGPAVASNQPLEKMPIAEAEEEERVMSQEMKNSKTEWLRLAGHHPVGASAVNPLNLRLIYHFLRRTEYRGSDIRLDLGLIWRPDAVARSSINPDRWVWNVGQAYRWRRPEHINLLELRAILRALEWRARSTTFASCRFVHLSDSQICLAVLNKGRSSSRRINRILRKIASLIVTLNLYPLWGWIQSRLNPADAPSRKYGPGY